MEEVAVDLSVCAGHGKCYRLAPKAFEPFNDVGQSRFIGHDLAESENARARIQAAINACPELALAWK